MRKIVIAIVLLAAVVSCVSIDCPVQNRVEATYTLKRPSGGTDTMGIDTLTVWTHRINYTDNKRDSILINRLCGTKATSFALPVSHTLTEDSIFTLLKDTVGGVSASARRTCHISSLSTAMPPTSIISRS